METVQSRNSSFIGNLLILSTKYLPRVINFPEIIILPFIAIPDNKVTDDLTTCLQEESIITVHCSFQVPFKCRIRIRNTTYLIDDTISVRSRLLHAINIPFYPVWMYVPAGKRICLTFYFSPLPESCSSFNMLEETTDMGAFRVDGIRRNKSDVYNVSLDYSRTR